MSKLDDLVSRTVGDQDAPFLVAMAATSEGVIFDGAAGDSSPNHAAAGDSLFRLFSMTKGLGSLAVLIMIDRGRMTLDTEVAEVLPSYKGLQVLESVGPDGPVLRPARRGATLRHLVTHTSGLAYEAFHPNMKAFQDQTGFVDYLVEGTVESLHTPLMFDPGDGWTYGTSLDWAGLMVQELDGRAIDQFCREEIFEPLGLNHTAFETDDLPDPLADLFIRNADGGYAKIDFAARSHPELYGLGNALYGTAPDYLRFLRFILNHGELDGVRLLSDATFDLILENQMGTLTIPSPIETCRPDLTYHVDHLFDQTVMTHTAGFLRTEQDIPGMRSAGSLWWAGFLNTHYWIDPKSDVAGVFMTQSLPFCDPRFLRDFGEFERQVYLQLDR